MASNQINPGSLSECLAPEQTVMLLRLKVHPFADMFIPEVPKISTLLKILDFYGISFSKFPFGGYSRDLWVFIFQKITEIWHQCHDGHNLEPRQPPDGPLSWHITVCWLVLAHCLLPRIGKAS